MQKVYHRVQLACLQCTQPFTIPFHLAKNGRKFCTNKCRTDYMSGSMPSTEQVIQLYVNEHKSAMTIGKEFGVSETAILNLLNRNGITPRKPYDHVLQHNPMQGKTHTEESREKIRKANQRQFSSQEARDRHASLQRQAMSDGKFKIISKAEKMVAQELTRMGILYTQQHLIRDPRTGQYCACVDIMLESGIAIEVNGTYWHSDPRFYPNGPIHESQKRTTENDARKAHSLKLLNIPLVIIWEHDIKTNASLAVHEALNFLEVLPPAYIQLQFDLEA